MGRLDNKVAVITGAASGIGRATARKFAAEGASVVVADFDDVHGPEIANEINGLFVKVNVADEKSVVAMYDKTHEVFGGIDILFNNAGISPADDDSILTTGLDAWKRVQDVNLTSVYLCCRFGIPHLQARGGGSIINTASFVAVLGSATSQISYTASKGGVLAMSRELAMQFAREKIRVNALCPGSNCSRRTPSAPHAGSYTCPWGDSANPKRSRTRSCSSRVMRPHSSPRRRSWSTAGSRAPTSRRCSLHGSLFGIARTPPLSDDDLDGRRDRHGQ